MRRAALLAAGLGTLALAWAPGGDHLFGHGFAAHMVRHMGVVAIAAPLIALAISGTRVDLSARAPLLFAAVPASLVELAVVWGWHAPAAHDLARTSALAFLAEQGSFLLAGLWLWLACFGHGAVGRARRAGEGALAMLLTSIHMTLLGALLAMSVRPLYAAHHAADPLADQHLGGIVMLLVGGAVYLAGGVALAARLLSEGGTTPVPPSPLRGGVGGGGGGGSKWSAADEAARRSMAAHTPAPPPPLPSPQAGGGGDVALRAVTDRPSP